MRSLSLTLGRTHFELCVGQAKQTYFLGTMFSLFKVRAHSSVVEQRSFKPLALGSNPNVLNWWVLLFYLRYRQVVRRLTLNQIGGGSIPSTSGQVI